MAVVKISELPAMEEVAGSDLLPIVDTSETETKKVTKQMLLTNIDGAEVKLDGLTEASTLGDNDLFLVNQSGTNKKVKKEKLQDKLVSGTNIKTINGVSLLSGGDMEVGASIPIQDTAPSNPVNKDLWIDTSDNNTLKYYNGTTWIAVSDNIGGDTLPIGSIVPYGSTSTPTGWLICDGSAVSRTTYAELFAVIGTSYGAGNGSTTFNLPNKKGRVSVGYDSTQTAFNTMGKTGGEPTVELKLQHIPNHTHDIRVNWENTQGSGIQTTFSQTSANLRVDAGSKTGGIARESQVVEKHNNLQPYQVDCWIIKASQSAGLVGAVTNTASSSTTDTYSCKYINDNLKATQLYNDASGTTGNVTLSSSSANFTYIEIFYGRDIDSTATCSSVKVYAPNGKRALLNQITTNSRTQASAQCFMSFIQELVSISGTSITRNAGNRASAISFVFTETSVNPNVNSNDIGVTMKIYRVVGYK